jgi:nucleotide-binding universal stress UspA family protein
MRQPLVWLHGDCLSPFAPPLLAYPDAPTLWVWDDQLLEEQQISLKRIVFIYECLLELPVEIRRGEVATEINQFARAHSADEIITTASPSPRFEQICQALELAVTILDVEPFVNYQGYIDLKRFSRYWRIAQRYVNPS